MTLYQNCSNKNKKHYFYTTKLKLNMNNSKPKSNPLGQKIRKIRELKGFSQEYVSSKLQVSQNALSKIENGHIKINESKLDRIAKIFGITVEDILNFSERIVFHNSKQLTHANIINDNPHSKIEELYERIIEQLKTENQDLRIRLQKVKKPINKVSFIEKRMNLFSRLQTN